MKKIIWIILCFCLLFTGCNVNNDKIEEDKFNIVTSFYPMYIATSNIIDGVEGVSISNMTNTEVGCLHDYQMTTRDMNKLEKADVFIINGLGMESFLDKTISAYPKLNVVDSSQGIMEQHNEENHVNDEEESHHSEDGHSHEHGENAHIWVSISLYIKQVENIAYGLAKYDEANKELYLSNAKNYNEKLQELKDEMHNKLDNLENKDIVTFHEAFEFFAEEFDLNIVSVIEREPGTNPSAGEVAKIIDKVKESNARAIFVEPQYEKSTANVIARETGIPVYTLDPIVTGELTKDAYEKLMMENINCLEEALK